MEQDLKELLRDHRPQGGRGWRCVTDDQIAGFVDGGLDLSGRRSIERHLADCNHCLAQVSFLIKSNDWEHKSHVPPQLLAKAKNLVAPKRHPTFMWDWRWATAVATCLFLAGVIFFAMRIRSKDSVSAPQFPQPDNAQAAASPNSSVDRPNRDLVASAKAGASKANPTKGELSAPAIRKDEASSTTPHLLFPRDGAVLRNEAVEFRWQPVPNALFYEVSIITAGGDTLLMQQTEGLRLQLPGNNQLMPGSKYFVSVRARLREGKTARSSAVAFRMAEQSDP